MKTEIICFGEVLWDILPDKELPGGAPMNVAYHLQKLRHATAMITRIGTDSYGDQLLALMQRYGLNTAYIQKDSTHGTGKVFASITPSMEMEYDIVYPSAWDFITPDITWEALEDAHPAYIVFGSLASRNNVSKQALEKLLHIPGKRVLDVNLRPPHFTMEHIHWLLEHADIIKLNIGELQEISNWYSFQGDMKSLVAQLAEKFLPEVILVTLGAEGCLLYEDGDFYEVSGHKVTVADTIGSGDALLAGYLHSRLLGSKSQAALKYANALGALVATKNGGCPQYDEAEIVEMMKQH
ncbi:carbohydrate kinase family protein [Chitinophaga sp. Cy-1792]|uniref:carbohydrate kinase family protein n=1 Tax=Chitinophaga sp. Cy-1792 TaxID=2608339 RepID=UPI00142294AB|nr:carbohydrate kinase [Chitinophaga sp. Cy-1792]NIG57133.1 carbohydrate kinase [Chitinophaga sp. Cy-1792]